MTTMYNDDDSPVPVFSKWRHWYWLVIAFQLVLIGLFYMITKYFA